MSLFAGTIAFLAAIFVIVLVHEAGHLLAARATGMPASIFSVGFGRRVWGFHWKGTEYRLSLIPLGGYVRIDPMEETVEGPHGPVTRFETWPRPARALVLSAGVLMNVVLAGAIYLAVPLVWGAEVEEPLRVAHVDASVLPAGAEGWTALPADARIVRMGGEAVESREGLLMAVVGSEAGATTVSLEDGRSFAVTVPDGDGPRLALVEALRIARPAVVGRVLPGSPAERSGLRPGDRIVSVDGRPVGSWRTWRRESAAAAGVPLAVSVLRDGASRSLMLTPERGSDGLGEAGVVRGTPRARTGLAGAAVYAGRSVKRTLTLIGDSFAVMVRGRLSARQVSGPVTIVETTVRVFDSGWEPFLAFVAFLSLNIAVVNLLPVPALDGGHLFMLAVETVRRRPVPRGVQAYLGRVGVIWLCLVMAGTLVNDVLRLTGL